MLESSDSGIKIVDADCTPPEVNEDWYATWTRKLVYIKFLFDHDESMKDYSKNAFLNFATCDCIVKFLK